MAIKPQENVTLTHEEVLSMTACGVVLMQQLMKYLKPDERVEYWKNIMEDYCDYCGCENCNGKCERDE